jgi:hypothetical protein
MRSVFAVDGLSGRLPLHTSHCCGRGHGANTAAAPSEEGRCHHAVLEVGSSGKYTFLIFLIVYKLWFSGYCK